MKKVILISISVFFVYACSNTSKKHEATNNKNISNNNLNTSDLSNNNKIELDKANIDTIARNSSIKDNKKIEKAKPLKFQLVSKTNNTKKKEKIIKNVKDKLVEDKNKKLIIDEKVADSNKINILKKSESNIKSAKKIIKQQKIISSVDERMRTFVGKKNKINGDWSFKKEGNKTYIVFYGNFKTKKGPDLEIFLTKKKIENVTSKNALNGSIFLENLKSNKGEQKYLIPPNIDLRQYRSIIIHCKKYTILWGGSTF